MFYDRHVSRIYDLKGSERNRFNEAAAANPQVQGQGGGEREACAEGVAGCAATPRDPPPPTQPRPIPIPPPILSSLPPFTPRHPIPPSRPASPHRRLIPLPSTSP